MEKLNKALDEVTQCIKDSKEYKTCIELKDKMNDNSEIKELVEEIKKLQQKYVKSNYDSKIKEELDLVESKLNSIPIYKIYLDNLSIVNEKIEFVKDELNDYFYNLLNKKNTSD